MKHYKIYITDDNRMHVYDTDNGRYWSSSSLDDVMQRVCIALFDFTSANIRSVCHKYSFWKSVKDGEMFYEQASMAYDTVVLERHKILFEVDKYFNNDIFSEPYY